MASYILLGHGGLEVSSVKPGMEWVAIPQGTTLQFFADTGQGLVTNAAHMDVFTELDKPWPALDSSRVTFNLTLSSSPELDIEDLKNNPSFGGAELIQPGLRGVPDPIKLCTGTPETCPTDPRQIPVGWKHNCDGILGTYSGDMYWIACTVVVGGDKAVVDAAMGESPKNVLIAQDPDTAHSFNAAPNLQAPRNVVPAVFDSAAADARNLEVLKALDDGDETTFWQGGQAVLIGDGHAHGSLAYLTEQGYVEGTVRIKKGGILSSGKLYVSGAGDQRIFEAAIARVSDKSVEFE